MEKPVVDFSVLPEEVLEEYDIEVYSSYEDVFWSLFLDDQEFTIDDAVELLKYDTMQEVVEAQPYMYKFGDKYYRWTEFAYEELAEKYPHAIVSEMDDVFKTETIQLDKLSGDYFAVERAIQKAYQENDVELASHFATCRAPDLSIEDVVRLYADLKGDIDGDRVFEFKDGTKEVRALWSLDEPFLSQDEIKGLFDDFVPGQQEDAKIARLRGALSNMRHELNGAAEFAPDLLPLKEKQYAILELQLDAALKGVDIDLSPDKIIDLEHLDCFWYGGYVGSIAHKGYTVSIEVHGDVRLTVLDEEHREELLIYNNRDNSGAYKHSDASEVLGIIKDDATLHRLCDEGRVFWSNNNWVEYRIFDTNGTEIELPIYDNVIDNNILDAFNDVDYYKELIDEIDQQLTLEVKSEKIAHSPLAFIFDGEIMLNSDKESVNGYLWAVDSLVDRLSSSEHMDNINFYADYNVRTGHIELIGSYYTPVNGEDVQKTVVLPLTDGKKTSLSALLEAHSSVAYNQSCLEIVNEARALEGKPLIVPTSSKATLSEQIGSAENKKSQEVNPLDIDSSIER